MLTRAGWSSLSYTWSVPFAPTIKGNCFFHVNLHHHYSSEKEKITIVVCSHTYWFFISKLFLRKRYSCSKEALNLYPCMVLLFWSLKSMQKPYSFSTHKLLLWCKHKYLHILSLLCLNTGKTNATWYSSCMLRQMLSLCWDTLSLFIFPLMMVSICSVLFWKCNRYISTEVRLFEWKIRHFKVILC